MKKSEATALATARGGASGVPQNAGKSEITNQELLQAINQNIDQKLSIQKDDILTAVNQNIDQKLAVQDNEISELKSTVNDVLLAVNTFADDVKKDISELSVRMGNVENKLGDVENRLSGVEATMNTQMVTKTDLDDAFAKFSVDANSKHKRVDKLTNILHKKKILNVAETQIVLAN